MVAGAGAATAQPTPAPGGEFDPFGATGKPDFSILGVEFTNWFSVILNTFWGALLGLSIFSGLWSYFKIGVSNKHGRPDDASDRTRNMWWSIAATGALLSAKAIWTMAGNLAIGGGA